MRNDSHRITITANFMAGYLPDRAFFYAAIDGEAHGPELTRALYDRVQAWTLHEGIVLGEGYTREQTFGDKELPATLSMFAPVIDNSRD